MKTYIALFRGINVGGKNILPMKGLKLLLEELGCSNVQTYIQSGNVVFQLENEKRNKIAEQISHKVLEQYKFEPKILLLDSTELEKAISNNPFETDNGKVLHFSFLDTHPSAPDLDGLESLKTETEKYKLVDKVFYLYAPDGIGRSKLAAKIEKRLGVPATARNWNTVKKLVDMVG